MPHQKKQRVGSSHCGGLRHPFKQALLKKIIRNDALYKIFTEAIGAGPLDGGCYALAKAFQKILDGELYSLTGIKLKGARQAEHVVLKSGDVYWDADGCSTKESLLKRWQVDEGLKMPELRPFKEADVSGSPRDNGLIKKVVEFAARVEE